MTAPATAPTPALPAVGAIVYLNMGTGRSDRIRRFYHVDDVFAVDAMIRLDPLSPDDDRPPFWMYADRVAVIPGARLENGNLIIPTRYADTEE